jgi:carbon storage regulator
MLVLTRKNGEGICVGDDITIYIVSIQGSKVKIGIDAPQNVKIDREEVRE